ncbi:hypothetical protein DDE83_002847 [Stemphylium lycopersici]|uniref:Uncharacterized protein n=1 Tax=Stemphylium lycopersici TaxID=183478 RepID=A0A364N978_STELY|nr:hypothetical protein DDE83_002847 [Stemphylium lycopersici]
MTDSFDFDGTSCAIESGKKIINPPKESGENVREPVKTPHSVAPSSDTISGIATGDNSEENTRVEEAHMILSNSSAPTLSYSLRNRKQNRLIYDLKYHPMDDSVRPTQAAKRRSAHGQRHVCFDSDDSSEASTVINTDTEGSGDEQSEIEKQPKRDAKGKKRKLALSQSLSIEPTRRSSRKVSDIKTSYNMKVHPQDEFLVISSDEDEPPVSKGKRKRTTRRNIKSDPNSDDGVAVSKPTRQQKVHGTDYSTSDRIDSTDDQISSTVQVETEAHTNFIADFAVMESSPSSPVAVNQGNCIRNREGMDLEHLSPGERYFPHGKYSRSFPPGQPFEIFHEKLEDQLAREALAASPLNYEHDDKENTHKNINAESERLSATHTGVSVIPAAQYIQSSDDRELSFHRALVNNVLYDDPAPETYGLDGTYSHHREESKHLADCMSILASGVGLPPGRTEAEPEVDSQDSVLGLRKPGYSTEFDLVMGRSSPSA